MSKVTRYVCSNCNQVATLNTSNRVRRRVLKDLVYEYYFVCSECDYEHVSYYTDQKIRRKIKRQKKRWKKFNDAVTINEARRIKAQIDVQDRLVKREMDKLKEQMLKVDSNG